MNALRDFFERLGMILALFVVPSILLLILCFNVVEEMAERETEKFLQAVSEDGILTTDEYVRYLETMSLFRSGYSVAVEHTSYVEEPYYEYGSSRHFHDYFSKRNLRSAIELPVEPVKVVTPDTTGLRLQTLTNADVIASVVTESGYLPLPEEDVFADTVYTTVIPVQECYVGDNLVTLVKTEENGVIYYVEADPVIVVSSGTESIQLTVNRQPINAYVEVIVYPKTFRCAYGHKTVVDRERVEEYKVTGSYGICDYCAMIPCKIEASEDVFSAEVGSEFTDLPLSLIMTCLDGSTRPVELDDAALYTDFDPNYCGTQMVTISYLGYKDTCFRVDLVGKECSVCGSRCESRCFADYVRYPYCNTCLREVPFFFGETYMQETTYFHDSIVRILEEQGEYYFNRNDYFQVTSIPSGNRLKLPFLGEVFSAPIRSGSIVRTSGRKLMGVEE